MSEVTLTNIEDATKELYDAESELVKEAMKIEAAISALKNRRKAILKERALAVKSKRTIVERLIEGAKHLFTKPRTREIWGHKVGFRKGRGGIVKPKDEEKLIAAIHKHLPDKAKALIKTVRTVPSKPLNNLTAQELKKIGCEIKNAGDTIVVDIVESDVDQVVATYMED